MYGVRDCSRRQIHHFPSSTDNDDNDDNDDNNNDNKIRTQRGSSILRTVSIGLGRVGGLEAADDSKMYLILLSDRATIQQ